MPDDKPHNPLIVIDETIREGMQFRGLVFSREQRAKILEFQETLGIDICQAGYPPAHESEQAGVASLVQKAVENDYRISVAAMGRASVKDIPVLAATGTRDFHLHAHLSPGADAVEQAAFFTSMTSVVGQIRSMTVDPSISIAVLDLGKSDTDRINQLIDHLILGLDIDILSLPDTSGMMGPNEIFDKISLVVKSFPGLGPRMSIHCHNDMGMACANTVMGVVAGASVVELSVLGIGERNGIADLYTTLAALEKQGFNTRVRLEDMDTFMAYYTYVNDIIRSQTHQDLLSYTTPFLGEGVKTHVAGTHAGLEFGIAEESDFRLNPLCGKHLVRQYLNRHDIPFNATALSRITQSIKSRSAELNRSLNKSEIIDIVTLIS